jgi:hypothetical protein
MDQSVFNWLIAACGGLGGWLMKVIWDAIKELKEEVRIVDRRLNSEYVRRDDFKESMADLKTDMRQGFQNVDGTLRLLFKKLENKEDK